MELDSGQIGYTMIEMDWPWVRSWTTPDFI